MNVRLRDSVMSVKERLEELEEIRVEQQKLVFGGQELVNQGTLEAYGVTNESTLYLILRIMKDCSICMKRVFQCQLEQHEFRCLEEQGIRDAEPEVSFCGWSSTLPCGYCGEQQGTGICGSSDEKGMWEALLQHEKRCASDAEDFINLWRMKVAEVMEAEMESRRKYEESVRKKNEEKLAKDEELAKKLHAEEMEHARRNNEKRAKVEERLNCNVCRGCLGGVCHKCEGSGNETCPGCSGRGYFHWQDHRADHHHEWVGSGCYDCGGGGYGSQSDVKKGVGTLTCGTCQGTGYCAKHQYPNWQ